MQWVGEKGRLLIQLAASQGLLDIRQYWIGISSMLTIGSQH
jgi:hypothetical protein